MRLCDSECSVLSNMIWMFKYEAAHAFISVVSKSMIMAMSASGDGYEAPGGKWK